MPPVRIGSNEGFRAHADEGSGFIFAVNGRQARIHHASCFHLTAFKNIAADFTSKPKYFSTSSDELIEFAKRQLGVALVPCKTCGA